MPNATQLARLQEKAKANAPASAPPAPPAPPALELTPEAPPAPAPEAQPTQRAVPILGPVTTPLVHNFSPAPLRGAQLAAHNRKLNAAGIAPAKAGGAAKASAPSARPADLDLVLRIAPAGKGLAVSFFFRVGDTEPGGVAIPLEERALRHITAHALPDDAGDLVPESGTSFTARGASANYLAAAMPLMRRLDAALIQAYEDSEDRSFPQQVLTLASALRVARIEVQQSDGSTTTAKRGAAYITAFKAWEAHRPKAD